MSLRPYTNPPLLVSLGRAAGLHGSARPLVPTQRRPATPRPLTVTIAVLEDEGDLLALEPDPGHPDRLQLALWRPPRRFGRDLVLDCHNATRDPRTGLYERVLLRVPRTCRTPVEAAAWTYGVDVDTYRTLQRRT